MEIEKLDLKQSIKVQLRKANLSTVSEVLSRPAAELTRILKIEQQELEELLKVVSRAAIHGSLNPVSQILHDNAFDSHMHVKGQPWSMKKLSTGCPILDHFLRGGLRHQGITELVGESASGKTQICLQLSLVAQLPIVDGGLDGTVLYICTENAFPIKRLRQLIENTRISTPRPKVLSDKIFIEHVEDIDGLHGCLERKLPIFVGLHNIKLLVIDSVAALFRSQFSVSEAVQRAQKLNVLGHVLHTVNAKFGITIVCINQISDIVKEDQTSSTCHAYGPSLGLAWSNIVNTRIMLSRTGTNLLQTPILEGSAKYLKININVRKMEIIFSPSLPFSWCYFVVNSSGVNGLESNN